MKTEAAPRRSAIARGDNAIGLRPAGRIAHLLVMAGAFLAEAHGQIVAWDFNGAAGNEASIVATTLNGNLSSSSVSRGSGINASALGNGFSATAFDNSALSGAESANEYFSFSISPATGFTVSLSTLDVNFRRSSTGPNGFQWEYSLDGFATSGVNIGSAISYTLTSTNGDAQTQLSLSGIPALQSITATSTVTLRLFGYGGTGGTFALGRLGGNDLAIGGSVNAVAVPEPSTYAAIIGAITFASVAWLRRRRPAQAAPGCAVRSNPVA